MDAAGSISYLKAIGPLLLAIEATDRAGSSIALGEAACAAFDLIQRRRDDSGKVMVIGNGGSAAVASHMQNDLCKAVGVPALVFHETPLLTALTNDNGYHTAFSYPVSLWAQPADLLVAISSSGQSESILNAVREAVERECHVITLSGFKLDNPLRRLGDLNFHVPSSHYGSVEMAHHILCHLFTDAASDAQPASSLGG